MLSAPTAFWRLLGAHLDFLLVGLVGVVVIVRPGTDSFSLLSILAVLGMLGFAGRDLASRAAPSTLSTSILGLYGLLSVVIPGVLYSIWDATQFAWPTIQTSLWLFGAVIIGVVAYFGLMKAMRTGEVSMVTPFRHSRLIFGIGLGVLLFDESLNRSMVLGCGFIGLRIHCYVGRVHSVEEPRAFKSVTVD